jgi:hypothetical protein
MSQLASTSITSAPAASPTKVMPLERSPQSLERLSKRLSEQSKLKRRDELARLRAASGIKKRGTAAFDRVRANLYLQESWARMEITHPFADLRDDDDEETRDETRTAIAAQ